MSDNHPMKPIIRTTVRLPDSLLARLARAKRKHGITFSEFFREALDVALRKLGL